MVARNIRVIVEGGGESNNALRAECRKAFKKFFAAGGIPEGRHIVEAAGKRGEAYHRFQKCDPEQQSLTILLVDSESRQLPDSKAWEHLKTEDHWDRPDWATEDQCHLMVVCMETWFLADPDALQKIFKSNFVVKKLPNTINLETLEKSTVMNHLSAVSSGLYSEKTKGQYSFRLLESLNPALVKQRCPSVKRLFKRLSELTE